MVIALAPFRINPDYGSGRYRRRILLRKSTDRPVNGHGLRIDAELEDCNHHFVLRVHHDERVITDIEASTPRIPFSTCPGAAGALRALIGHALPTYSGELALSGQPRQHCTHLFDLLELALNHRLREAELCRYDIVVEDERDGLQTAIVQRDDRPVHEWPVIQGQLQPPFSDSGQRLLGGGFGQWARQRFSGDALEAAHTLQRGYLVAQARRYDVDGGAGRSAADDPMPGGVCYTYQPEQAVNAIRLTNTVRDFSAPGQHPLQASPLKRTD